MKENVISLFLNSKKELNINNLMRLLNIRNLDEKIELLNILYELELEGIIINLNHDSYIKVPENFYLKRGIVAKSTKGNLYVTLGKGDIVMISKNDEDKVNVGDTIYFEPIPDEEFKHKYFCKIERIVRPLPEKTNYLISATIEHDYNRHIFYIVTDDNHKVLIPEEYLKDAFTDDEVSVRIIYENGEYYGKVENVNKRGNLEHVYTVVRSKDSLVGIPLSGSRYNVIKDIPSNYKEGDYLIYTFDKDGKLELNKDKDKNISEIEAYALELGIKSEFDEKTLDEANKISADINYNERVDLRNLTTFTIDSEDAKDLDDAISIEKKGNNYILYVSIADVSHYVYPGTNLFKEAFLRGTSIYPANFVIPMLPKRLSNGICSLNENEEKLAKTVIMEINELGDVVNFNIVNSVIKSDKKMSYKKVNMLLDGTYYPEDYIKYYSVLKVMSELANILQERRMKRGYICLNTDEYKYEIDSDGNVINLDVREKGQSHLIIENFMLIANEVVAGYLKNLDIKGAYRNHECPSPTKIMELKRKFNELGRYTQSLCNAKNPKILQNMLLSIMEGKSEEEITYISKIMLKSLSRAYYSSINKGHYGLALDEYAQFTSPIRRFTDLLNHLVIGYIIEGKYDKLEELTKDYEDMCIHTNEKEIETTYFEEVIDDLLFQRFVRKYIGEKIDAKVKFIGRDFIYIKTMNGLCGIIPLGHKIDKKNDYVSINGSKLRVGDNINVMLEDNIDARTELKFKYLDKQINKQRKKEMNV